MGEVNARGAHQSDILFGTQFAREVVTSFLERINNLTEKYCPLRLLCNVHYLNESFTEFQVSAYKSSNGSVMLLTR